MDSAPLSGSNFIFEKEVGADKEKKDYAKMAILLAFEEFPDDDYLKCNFVSTKFEEKYGGNWLTSFIKNGDVRFWYNGGVFLKLKYKDYNIKISKIS